MSNTASPANFRVSHMAENLIGSEIIKLAGEIRELMAKGEKIYNYTIGDFDPKIFPIPADARYNATGEPKPPAPITTACAASSLFCPSIPISSSSR